MLARCWPALSATCARLRLRPLTCANGARLARAS
ncbi:hypothetical protein [Mycobacterium phage Fezzik]|nr:hypothetical protein [Mycobacterium phage Fezzik]